jgi:hypothetical protein
MGAARQSRSKQITARVDKQPPSRAGGADAGREARQCGWGATPSWEFDNRAERVRAACDLQAEKVAIRIGAQVRDVTVWARERV